MLNNIQFLRAVAASLVVMQHSFVRGESYKLPAAGLAPLEGFGLSGVDIFFVISGFIMAYSQRERPKTPYDFILGRLLRIAPLYWAWTALITGLIITVPSVFRTLQIDIEHIVYSIFFLSQAVLGEPPFIDLGWTLEYEMLFYLVFTFTLFFEVRQLQLLSLGAVILIIAIVFKQWIIIEFLLGVIAFWLLPMAQRHKVGVSLIAAGIVGFAIMHVWFIEAHRLWSWGLPSFFLVLGLAASQSGHSRVLSYLGDASYSIYLVQVASIPLFYKIASVALTADLSTAGNTPVISVGDLLIFGSVAFSLLLGVLLHEIVEKPATQIARRIVLLRRKHSEPQ